MFSALVCGFARKGALMSFPFFLGDGLFFLNAVQILGWLPCGESANPARLPAPISPSWLPFSPAVYAINCNKIMVWLRRGGGFHSASPF